MTYETPGCSFAASAVREGISYKIATEDYGSCHIPNLSTSGVKITRITCFPQVLVTVPVANVSQETRKTG